MAAIINGVVSTEYIADRASPGLRGVNNCTDYRIAEIERHLHSSGRWFEKATTPDGETHVADRIGDGAGAFRIDAGDDDWGAWVQILGSSDTPADTGKLYFDPHEIVIAGAERAATYFLQITRGASGDAGFAAGTYTEVVLDTLTRSGGVVIKIQTGRAQVGSKLWARCKSPSQNTGTFDFYFGVHEYEG